MNILVFENSKPREAQVSELGELLRTEGTIIWMDIFNCGDDEAAILRDIFHFHPLAIEDTRNQRQRPKLEEYEDYLFIIMNSVQMATERGIGVESMGSVIYHDLDFRELDLFVGRNYVVSVHNADSNVISEARRRVMTASASTQMNVGYLMYTLLDVVVDRYFPIMDMLEEAIGDLEDRVLIRPTQENMNRLFELKHMLLHMWRIVWPERDILSNLTQPHLLAHVSGTESSHYYLRDVADHLLWIADMINTYRDTLTTIIDIYMSSVSNRLNQVVNRLTILTLVIGVMTVVSGFYGMNFLQTWPPFDAPWGVPFVLLVMALGIIGILGFLRWVNRKYSTPS